VDLTVAPDLDEAAEAVRAALASGDPVVPVGARTHWEVGGAPPRGVEVRAPAGIAALDPADLTVTLGAGTPVSILDAALAEHGQQCPLDPPDRAATVGGVLACGLSGTRRLGLGPLRDAVLEVRAVTGLGRLVKGGGPTVKNVTGYDLPRLFVGSLGTLAVLLQVTLRCRPIAAAARWGASSEAPDDVRARLHAPASVLFDGERTHVLVEGHPADVDAQLVAAGLAPAADGPPLPAGTHRGRASVPPGAVGPLVRALRDAGTRALGEAGVGTVHVATDSTAALSAARSAAAGHGGWMLRECGDDGADGFGVALPDLSLHRRLKAAFDPDGRLNPGRLPL
jgi:glycolate oxidase FAD binding subunit